VADVAVVVVVAAADRAVVVADRAAVADEVVLAAAAVVATVARADGRATEKAVMASVATDVAKAGASLSRT